MLKLAPFRVAAVDLGASSGRVSVVDVDDNVLRVTCVRRFDTSAICVDGCLVWDITRIFAEIEAGLAAAAATGRIDSVGIDSWGCDYGLVSQAGDLKQLPSCYRDKRTLTPDENGASTVDLVHETIDRDTLYAMTGTQFQPFNTLYQLVDDARHQRLHLGDVALMIPDLVAYWLTGHMTSDVTNLSTTGLVDPWRRQLAAGLMGPLRAASGDADNVLFAQLLRHWRQLGQPGCLIGLVTADIAQRTGLPPATPVVGVATHDTASAVVAVPVESGDGDHWAYISSGTWSLVGVELPAPVVTQAGGTANFTNELGVANTVRYLRNITGLWVLNECVRAWQTASADVSMEALVNAAANEATGVMFDIDDPSLLSPGLDMPVRVARLMGRDNPPQASITRAILDSLASAYARAVNQVEQLCGRHVKVIHIVGGGSQNGLLCQLTADATGLPVIAGPVEASTIGNALVQAWALGWRVQPSGATVSQADLENMRRLVARTQPLLRYEPRSDVKT